MPDIEALVARTISSQEDMAARGGNVDPLVAVTLNSETYAALLKSVVMVQSRDATHRTMFEIRVHLQPLLGETILGVLQFASGRIHPILRERDDDGG